MTKFASVLIASALSLAVASPALAGWDRNQVVDPAFSRSIDRQLEAAGNTLGAQPVETGSVSAIATNDAPVSGADYFGANLDRAVESQDSPYDN